MNDYKVIFKNENGEIVYSCQTKANNENKAIESGSKALSRMVNFDKRINLNEKYYPEVQKVEE